MTCIFKWNFQFYCNLYIFRIIMGQCCAYEAAQTQHFDAQSFKLKEKEEGLRQEQAIAVNNVVQIDDIKLEEVQVKLTQQEKKQQQWLQEEEQKIKVQEEKKQQYLDFHQFIHLYQKCIHFYKVHDIDSSCDLIKEMQALMLTIKQTRQLDQENFISTLKTIEQQWQKVNIEHRLQHYDEKNIEMIEQQMKDLLYYYNEVYKAPFIEKYNEDGVKISTRKEESSIGAIIQTELHVPFEYFAFILTEIPYFQDVVPYCESSALMKDCARNSKVGYIVLNFPMIARREAYFQGTAYFRFKHKKDIFLYTRSIHDKPELQKAFEVNTPLNKDYVALDYKYFVINYEPLREGVGKLKFAFNIDNGVHFLPEFIEDYITREFGKKFFQNILKISRKFKGSKWEKSMIEKPELSLFMKQKIREQLEYLKQLQHQQK